MLRSTLPVLCCLLLAAAPSGAEVYEHPLAGNDALLPFHSVASGDGLLSLYVNPAGLAMRPGELSLLYYQGLRAGTDDPALDAEFANRFSGDWTAAAGGRIAFGVDRAEGIGGFDYDLAGDTSAPRWRKYWRGNVGFAQKVDLHGQDMQIALGAVYRWTRSEAYALDRLSTWDLGAVVRWKRWLSLGGVIHDVGGSPLKGLFPGDRRRLDASYRYGLALRPKVDWATFALDVLQTRFENGWDYSTRVSAELAPVSASARLRFAMDDDQRWTVALFYGFGGADAGLGLGNRHGGTKGTRYGSAGVELSSHRFGRPLVPKRRFLDLAVGGAVPDAPPPPRLIGGPAPRDTRALVDLLRKARGERDLAGILIRLEDPQLGLPQLEELREAVLDYRRYTGLPVVFYADAFDTEEIYLASAGSRIVVNPAGEVWLTGLALDRPYLAGAMEKLGIEAQLVRHGRYKSATETFTARGPSADAREADSTALASRYATLKRGIAEGRRLDLLSLDEIVDRGYYAPPTAQLKGLVDAVLHPDQLPGYLEDEGGTDRLLAADDLERRRYRRRRWGVDPAVALIHVTGLITLGESGMGPLGRQTGAATVAAALKTAREDPRVRAVVLRVDSGGGGTLASERIRREVLITRQKKPVIVSMGNAGASGAYLFGVESTKLFADRSTITGSIGVFGGKFYVGGLMDKLGVGVDGVSAGRHARVRSAFHPYDEEQLAELQARLDATYQRFTETVAARRRISRQEVDLLGRGRIWTGEDALQLGLVDELGGLDRAMRSARREAGIDPGRHVDVLLLPPRRGALALLFGGGAAAAFAPGPDLAALAPLLAEDMFYLEPAAVWESAAEPLTP